MVHVYKRSIHLLYVYLYVYVYVYGYVYVYVYGYVYVYVYVCVYVYVYVYVNVNVYVCSKEQYMSTNVHACECVGILFQLRAEEPPGGVTLMADPHNGFRRNM